MDCLIQHLRQKLSCLKRGVAYSLTVSLPINQEYSTPLLRQLNPIHTGKGVFSTSRPVNCSELQNETSYNLETW